MPKISIIIQLYGGFDTERLGFSDFQRYSADHESRGRGPAFSMREVHCGGTLIPTSSFYRVGDYCEDCVGWGCDDAGLHWILASRAACRSFPYDARLEVIHLDHSREYITGKQWPRRQVAAAEVVCSDAQVSGHLYA